MSLRQRIEDDLLTAVKSKDALTRDVLRSLKSSLKNQEIELKTDSLDDNEIEKIISREAKKRKESIDAFNSANKPELVDVEKKELELLNNYLPEQLPEEKVVEIVEKILADLGDTANIGSAMKEAGAQLRGKADMGMVSKLVAQKLAK